MKDKIKKRHYRLKVDWNQLRLDLHDIRVNEYFWCHYADSKVNNQRKSYYAIKHVFGKDLCEAYRYSGCLQVFPVLTDGVVL